jgi:toxin-antitoxin system PIN domain toxin
MRALLDVNVLIALLDPDHVSHAAAMTWFSDNAQHGWASCPITQNGCIRILSHPGYPNSVPPRVVIERLAEATASEVHEFWPDDVCLLDGRTADATRIHGPRQLTDLYLLALAVRHDGKLVTFDKSIALDAVHGAQPRHLLSL